MSDLQQNRRLEAMSDSGKAGQASRLPSNRASASTKTVLNKPRNRKRCQRPGAPVQFALITIALLTVSHFVGCGPTPTKICNSILALAACVKGVDEGLFGRTSVSESRRLMRERKRRGC